MGPEAMLIGLFSNQDSIWMKYDIKSHPLILSNYISSCADPWFNKLVSLIESV